MTREEKIHKIITVISDYTNMDKKHWREMAETILNAIEGSY